MSYHFCSSIIVWPEQRDVTFLREVAAEGLLIKKRNLGREVRDAWQTVAKNLKPVFDTELTSRSVRDHYNNLSSKLKASLARKMRASGEGGKEINRK